MPPFAISTHGGQIWTHAIRPESKKAEKQNGRARNWKFLRPISEFDLFGSCGVSFMRVGILIWSNCRGNEIKIDLGKDDFSELNFSPSK